MNVLAIRKELRTGQSEELAGKRKIVALSVLGLIDFGVLSLYQTGIIKKLPDLPLSLFDANKVSASKEAFLFGLPDGPIASTLYSLTMVLATAGGSKRTGRSFVFDKLLNGLVSISAAVGLFYLSAMVKNKKVCLYCFTGAVINFASAAIQLAPKRARRTR